MKVLTVVTSLVWLGMWSNTSLGASFNCGANLNKVESMICGSSELSSSDEMLGQVYKDALRSGDTTKEEQRQWVLERNKCLDVVCLQAVYDERILQLVRQGRGSTYSGDSMLQANTPAPTPAADAYDGNVRKALPGVLKHLDSAVAALKGYDMFSSSSVSETCKKQVAEHGGAKYFGLNEREVLQLESECMREVTKRLNALSITGASQSCKLWAYARGDEWFKAKPGMEYAPFVKSSGHPVMFFGEVTNIKGKSIVVYDKGIGIRPPINAIVDVSDETVLVNPAKVAIGNRVIGYGVVVGSQEAKLVSGQETVLSKILASCIE